MQRSNTPGLNERRVVNEHATWDRCRHELNLTMDGDRVVVVVAVRRNGSIIAMHHFRHQHNVRELVIGYRWTQPECA